MTKPPYRFIAVSTQADATCKLSVFCFHSYSRKIKTNNALKRHLLSAAFVLVAVAEALATHIVGGNLNYQNLGGNQYQITLQLYRDCNGGQADFDNPAALGIFNTQTGALIQTLSMTLGTVSTLQSTINSSCVTAPTNICVEVGNYTTTVNLPPIAGGYTLAYQRCCRNGIIQNIVNPGAVGTTIVATIPGSGSSPNNSNPVWNILPPIYVCANLPFTLTHDATDPDGDVLVYSLYTPYAGATAGAPQPNPPSAPPYTPVPWGAGFSETNMLGGASNFSIDPATGVVTALPGTLGNFLIGLRVTEFRNGVPLSETIREFQLNVVNCQSPVAIVADVNSVGPQAPFTNCTPFVEFNAVNSAGFSISWDFGDPTTVLDVSTIQSPTYTYPGPGVYPLTLTVFNPVNPADPLCTSTVQQNITIQPPVTPDAGPDLNVCANSPVQLGGPGVAGHTYSWSPATGLNNTAISNPTTTITGNITYTVTETDQAGCTGTDQVAVSILPAPTANAGTDAVICTGNSTQLQASGGVSYAWTPSTGLSNPNIASPVASPTATTTYTVEVTANNGCTATDSVLITVNGPQLAASAAQTNICVGASTQLNATGATTYSWNPAAGLSNPNIANPVASPASTTTYTVTATDGSGCVSSQDVTINVLQLPAAVAGSDAEVCAGNPTTLGSNPIPGLTYSWSPSAGLSNANIANPVATPTATTTYTLTATTLVGGCQGTAQVTVTVNPLPNINAGPATLETCEGIATQLQASGAGGSGSYVWSPAAGLSNANLQNPVATINQPTVYTVTGTNANGCSNTDQISLTLFTVQATSSGAYCAGGNAQLNASGGVSWSWSPAAGLSSTTVQNPTASPTSTTTYTVSASNGTCNASATVTQSVNQLPNISAGNDVQVCPGGSPQLTATGGVSYVWSPSTGLSNPNIANPIVTLSGQSATYSVVGTDANGCQNSDQITVGTLTLPAVAVFPANPTICEGQSVNLTASGGTSYEWSPAAGLSSTNTAATTATPPSTSVYTVTVSQPTGNVVFNGNFDQGNVGFTSDYLFSNNVQPEGRYSVVPNANSVHPAFQGTGHTGNNPDNFMVVNGAGTPGLNVWCQTVSVTPNTEYSFSTWVSTLVSGSPAILQFSINGVPLATPFTAPAAVGQWVQFFQIWNSGAANTATICILNQNTTLGGNDFGLDDITFTTVCTQQAQATVNVNPLPQPSLGPDVAICRGSGTQLSAPAGLGTYVWSPPIGLNNANIANPIANPFNTTTYTLTVQDALGCQGQDEIEVTVNPLPQASAGPDKAVCVGQSTILDGGGGTAYSWSPATFLSNPSIQLPESTPTSNITYILTVTDQNGCENTDTVSVVVNQLPTISAGPDSLLCLGGSMVMTPSGGVSYAWSPAEGLSDPNAANPTATPIAPITYTVVGTDGNGCQNTAQISLTFFTATAGPDSVVCLNQSVQAFASAGSSYLWEPAAFVSNPTSANPILTPNGNTVFTVTVTNYAGCTAVAQVALATLTLPSSQFVAYFEPTCDGVLARFDNQSDNAEGQFWNFGDGGTSGQYEPYHVYPPGQGFAVTLITYNNDSLCTDTLVIDYTGQWIGNDTIDIQYGVAFTPNNDGLNDCFRPAYDGNFSDCYSLVVYNRWGGLIFESVAGQGHCWDGRTKAGTMAEEGTYYYIVTVKGYEKTGFVTLIY